GTDLGPPGLGGLVDGRGAPDFDAGPLAPLRRLPAPALQRREPGAGGALLRHPRDRGGARRPDHLLLGDLVAGASSPGSEGLGRAGARPRDGARVPAVLDHLPPALPVSASVPRPRRPAAGRRGGPVPRRPAIVGPPGDDMIDPHVPTLALLLQEPATGFTADTVGARPEVVERGLF